MITESPTLPDLELDDDDNPDDVAHSAPCGTPRDFIREARETEAVVLTACGIVIRARREPPPRVCRKCRAARSLCGIDGVG